ncbi:Clp protease N-terminal domain-containing protein [Actinomadura sp. SCN-SB]|uniref:Clp protease N-terminal domain-containing protein n=1 Tax=Actinomadura sp. SCN-SB TaxID=3373092 RepID=UPI003753B76F
MWDRLSPEGAHVVRYAYLEAREFGHQLGRYPWTSSYIGDEHVLLGILRYGQGPATALLRGRAGAAARDRADVASAVDVADALRGFGAISRRFARTRRPRSAPTPSRLPNGGSGGVPGGAVAAGGGHARTPHCAPIGDGRRQHPSDSGMSRSA